MNHLFLEQINPIVSKKIIIYGAGWQGKDCAKRLIEMNSNAVYKILCFVDADKNKQGKEIFGIPVISPNELEKYERNIDIVVTPVRHIISIICFLQDIGFTNIFYTVKFGIGFIQHAAFSHQNVIANRKKYDNILQECKDKIEIVRNSLSDKRSVEVFEAKLKSNFYGEHAEIELLNEPNQYFPRDIINLSDSEVFVDCGAFDGYTTIYFCNRVNYKYGFIYSFEPEPSQFLLTKESLNNRYKIENFEIFNYGVFNSEKELSFKINGDSSKICDDGDVKIQTISLDKFFSNQRHIPTYIKMDIEGAEMEALEGCEKIIDEFNPKFAVCAYHKITDIFEIPYFFIKNPKKYKVYLRQHSNVAETVCYAI